MKSSRPHSLTRLVLTIAIGILLMVSAIYVAINYQSTQNAIEHELSRSFDYRNRITELLIQELLEDQRVSLAAAVDKSSLKGYSPDYDLEPVRHRLELFSLSAEGSFVDILGIANPGDTLIHDVSSPLLPQAKSLLENYLLQHSDHAEHWQLVATETDDGYQVALLNSLPIIEPLLGRAVGTVVYGISINDNAPLLNTIRRNAELAGVEILLDSKLLASTFTDPSPQENGYLSSTASLPFHLFGTSLNIRSFMESAIRQELNAAYKKNLVILLVISVLAALIAMFLIRRITTTSFGQLMAYAEAVRSGKNVAKFQGSSISEFDQLGTSLESMVVSLQRTKTRLQQSNQFIESVINGIPDPVFVKDEDHRWTVLNDAMCELVDSEREEMLGKASYDFFPKELQETIRESDKLVLHSDIVESREESIETAEGVRIVSVAKTSFANPTTGKRNLVGTLRDITDYKRVEEALRRAQRMDAVGQMAGGIAHDFNNILGIVLGNLSLLKRQLSENELASNRIEVIEKSAQRAANLTSQLLDFSRQQPSDSSIVDINQMISEMDHLIERSVTPEIEVEQRFEKEVWPIEIDAGDFHDALLNLILNARDGMPGGGRLTLETDNSVLDEGYCQQNPNVNPGEYVQLSVSDSGVGIPRELHEHIFEPFFTTKTQGKGTGLGLAMVFGFVKRSRGHIKVYSEPDIGTTFKLYIPRYTGEKRDTKEVVEYQMDPPRGTESILVVDDEKELLDLAEEYLLELGYRVKTANDGVEAMSYLTDDESIELLFSDVVMPNGMNGYELAEKAVALRPQLKVLLTSGYTEKATALNGQARFNANLLSKPYTQHGLATRVRLILESHKRPGI